MTDRFNGFLPQAPGFLERLAANNNKAWFDEHRDQYEELLLEPLKLLVGDLAETVRAIDPALITIPAVDKTISRIYRDTRFSRNKSPCRTCLWITFKRRSPDWKQAPASSSSLPPTATATAWAFTAPFGKIEGVRLEVQQGQLFQVVRTGGI